MVDSTSESALKKSSKDDSTSAGSLRYSDMQALKPSSISSNGTISSKSVASLEGEIGGVGMLSPNFLQTASEGVEKSPVERSNFSSTLASPPSQPETSKLLVDVIAVGG